MDRLVDKAAKDASAGDGATTLVIASASWSKAIAAIKNRTGTASISVLNLRETENEPVDLPPNWQRMPASRCLDMPSLCTAFLKFVEGWPQQTFGGKLSFDQQFRLSGDYSLWWARIGSQRVPVPNRGIFWTLRCLWIVDQAIRSLAPGKVLLQVSDPHLASLLHDRCRRAGIVCESLGDLVLQECRPWSGRWRWFMHSLVRLIVAPLKMLTAHVVARWTIRGAAAQFRPSAGPVVVCSSRLTRNFDVRNGQIEPVFWEDIRDALTRIEPRIDVRYFVNKWQHFLGCDFYSWWYSTGWTMVGRLKGVLPLMQQHLALQDYFKALPAQCVALMRYFRLERTEAFRGSFQFAGADIATLFVPVLREVVATMAQWAQSVGSIRESIRTAGDVRAMLVVEEFYETALGQIAAARQLRIPTIGVQHGTIHPMHLIYTVPQGHVLGAPTPDYFAAYGTYAKEIVSSLGAYPADRVWVTGGSRFDALINRPVDRDAARRRLKLPTDKRIILLATQSYWWFPAAARALFEIARRHPDWLVCVKKHPSVYTTKMEQFREAALEAGLQGVQYFEDRFSDLLGACDVLISSSSTTILEAVLLGRRAISVNLSGEPDWYPYVQDGGALPARTVEELETSLGHSLNDPMSPLEQQRRREFLARHAGPAAEGKAADTLAKRILELCVERSDERDSHATARGSRSDHKLHAIATAKPVRNRGKVGEEVDSPPSEAGGCAGALPSARVFSLKKVFDTIVGY